MSSTKFGGWKSLDLSLDFWCSSWYQFPLIVLNVKWFSGLILLWLELLYLWRYPTLDLAELNRLLFLAVTEGIWLQSFSVVLLVLKRFIMILERSLTFDWSGETNWFSPVPVSTKEVNLFSPWASNCFEVEARLIEWPMS